MRRVVAGLILVCGLVVPVASAPPARAALNAPAVGLAATPSGQGYWIVARDGGVFAFGDARFHGSAGALRLNAAVLALAPTAGGNGYWLAAADGGIFTYGDAVFHGSTGAMRLNAPVTAMNRTPSGGGYWLVASDGGIFAFGDARFRGSTGSMRLNAPVLGMAPTPTGEGYWLVGRDGGVFSFGDAAFFGSTGSIRLNAPIVGMVATPTGRGYWMVAADGGIFTFGDARFFGSTGSLRLNAPIVAMAASPDGAGYWLVASDGGIFNFGSASFHGSAAAATPPPASSASRPPTLAVSAVMTGLSIPWDVAFTPEGAMLVTERAGRLRVRLADGTQRLLADISGELYARGEDGLMSIAVDPDFASTRAFWTCYTNASPRDVRVVRWTVDAAYTAATRTGATVTGIPSTADIHNGCRVKFGHDGALWIGTGDSAQGPAPQSTSSLGGKILRVDKQSGAAFAGNPNGSRVYTSGHRNVQGLAARPGSTQMFSVEHGPTRDDEVNLLRAGGNGGWDPNSNGAYNQSVPMTDTVKFPDAMRPIWSSGSPTLATSGASFVSGTQWGTWNGALVVACLKASQLRVLGLDAGGAVVDQTAALTDQGRLRSVTQGPDGALYITTSNGSNDRVLRVAAT